MKEKITLNNLVKVLIIFLILSGIFYLWILMFHLRLNPDMLKKNCGYSYSLGTYVKARQILNKQLGEFVSSRELNEISNQLPPKEYHCSRQSIFKRTQ